MLALLRVRDVHDELGGPPPDALLKALEDAVDPRLVRAVVFLVPSATVPEHLRFLVLVTPETAVTTRIALLREVHLGHRPPHSIENTFPHWHRRRRRPAVPIGTPPCEPHRGQAPSGGEPTTPIRPPPPVA